MSKSKKKQEEYRGYRDTEREGEGVDGDGGGRGGRGNNMVSTYRLNWPSRKKSEWEFNHHHHLWNTVLWLYFDCTGYVHNFEDETFEEGSQTTRLER